MSLMDHLVAYLESQHGDEPPDDTTIARAFLAVIREPSPGMVRAGTKKVRGGTAEDCAAATWRAMVDEVLKER